MSIPLKAIELLQLEHAAEIKLYVELERKANTAAEHSRQASNASAKAHEEQKAQLRRVQAYRAALDALEGKFA